MQNTLAEFAGDAVPGRLRASEPEAAEGQLDQVTIQAKLGSMVAYQGEVSFEHAGSGGMGRLLKKAVTGEGQSLMKMSGTGRGLPRRHRAGDPPALCSRTTPSPSTARTCSPSTPASTGTSRRSRAASGVMARRPLQHGAPRHRLGGDRLRRPAGAPEPGGRAHLRRSAGGDHLVVEREDADQDGHQAEEPHRAGSGESIQMSFTGPGLGARAAERGPGARPRGGGGGLLGNLGG